MERKGQKRQNPSEEMEAAEAKRLCCDVGCKSDHVSDETISEMDANDSDSSTEKVEEDLVSETMKSLQEGIMSSSPCEDESVTSKERHERVGNGESGSLFLKDSVEYNSCCNVEFEYLWGTGDEELRIMTSPEWDFVESVNDECFCDCDYNPDYGFFECLLMERELEQQLLLENLWSSKDTNDDSYCIKELK